MAGSCSRGRSRQDPRPLCRERRRGTGSGSGGERGEQRGRAGDTGAAAPGSEDEEARPAEEEDEEVWEDGDSGHQRLGKAQIQNPLRLKQRQGTFWNGKSQSELLWERKMKDANGP
ncbi:uncharacterized protein LOC116445385 isoform X3 [Corvus moneduloides]|uniref:uncharacterized protein LOC116445385 isoform X3 n=1 Tax=Corvus moneduloides TaxID=1196302 RepID=UPI001363CCB2|nr:uncharacterized protein LOC116445385 isoform X3 [Corvus moneduloides]